jgi:hypothetical protein
MPTFYLVLIWAGLGLIAGALALAARFKPMAWGRSGWLWILLLGIGSALTGGMLGDLLFGRVFATPAALWVAVLATFAPWLFTTLRARPAEVQRTAPSAFFLPRPCRQLKHTLPFRTKSSV